MEFIEVLNSIYSAAVRFTYFCHVHNHETHDSWITYFNSVFAMQKSYADVSWRRHHHWRSMIEFERHPRCASVFSWNAHSDEIRNKNRWNSVRIVHAEQRRREWFPQLNASLPCSKHVGLSYRFWLWYFDEYHEIVYWKSENAHGSIE